MKHHILIAGGGIGGLAAALALLERGHDVDVYEQAPELKEVGAGVQISPNGNRALHALGVFEAMQRLSCNTAGKEVRLWNTGKTWKLFDLGTEAVERYGFPYATVYRPDLLQVLADAVRAKSPTPSISAGGPSDAPSKAAASPCISKTAAARKATG